jgi:uncharacterized SAM-binding protein YcdF (DUF218 family)
VKRLLRATAFAALPLLLLALLVGPRLGSFLVLEHPLTKADVIYVLGGSRMERPLEAADLYRDGWAPLVLLSRQRLDGGEHALRERKVPFATEADLQRTTLATLGVPLDAIEILKDEQVSTAAEADALLARAVRGQWSRIIVVTSMMHTRRAGIAIGRRLEPLGIDVLVRGSRYDQMDVEHWWRDRDDFRFTLFEYQKLALYWVGLAD